jgi:hypothetical protein
VLDSATIAGDAISDADGQGNDPQSSSQINNHGLGQHQSDELMELKVKNFSQKGD